MKEILVSLAFLFNYYCLQLTTVDCCFFFSLFCLNFSKQFTQLLFATVSLCFRGEGRVSFGNIKSMLKLKFVLQLFARIFDRAFTLRYVCVSKFEFCVAPF